MSSKPGPSDDADEKREDPEHPEYSYSAQKVNQNGHIIYFSTIPIDDLFPYCFVERFNENPEEGYQRKYDERRANDIAEYLNTEGDSIPINIVLSAQPAAELTYTRKTKQLSYQRVREAFVVIDGQHRLWGYKKCKARHRVPVAIYEGLDQATRPQRRGCSSISTTNTKESQRNFLKTSRLSPERRQKQRRIYAVCSPASTQMKHHPCAGNSTWVKRALASYLE